LRQRVASYWADLADRPHLTAMVRRIDRIEAVACGSVHEAAWLERNLLETSMPRWNRTPGGQEVPVYIRMSIAPAAPGLSVTHEVRTNAAVRYFGPYLGGTRVRQAVVGVERILPLAYAGTRLRGAELDMARQRGVTEADRVRLVDEIAAVLDREPDAVDRVRTGLQRLRDLAAARLGFELAGRVEAEIAALEWITSTQRVTTFEPADVEVYGWAADMLVRYVIRAGRLSEWSQRACSRPKAAPRLAGTPEAWIEFAQRNAELAAALAGR
jgi:excinuclease ABC subunit C